MCTLIIAEAGVNHNADLNVAERMVFAAKEAGADMVKFQTAKPELVISRFAEMADYQKLNTGRDQSQLDMCKRLHLPFEAYPVLKSLCDEVGIGFLSTPFDLLSIDLLDELGTPFWKVPSGEVTNLPYLVRIAESGRPVVMSTGMCELAEVGDALDVLRSHGAGPVTLLHCTTEYPAPYGDVNLRAMLRLREEFGCEVGYSDHTAGIEVPVAAVAMGATVIEKHFTLDRDMEGPDHRASLEPNELAAMVRAIRHVEAALGSGEKRPSASERKNIAVARKSIVAARDIAAGEVLTEENMTTKRPGNGVSPMRWNEVLGTRAMRDFAEDELIEL